MTEETVTLKEFLAAMGEHLTELRRRMFIAFAALTVAIVVCIFFAESIMDFLCKPIGGLSNLIAIEITENVVSVFNVSLLAGFILALPIITYELLAFVIPALEPNEKHLLFTFLPGILLFFLVGIVFAYTIILPAAIPFLTSFMGIRTEIRPSNYISFTTSLIFWIGVAFEMPIITYIAARLHVVNSKLLLHNWRIAIVICAILAMIITPTVDPVNMMILMLPLVGLYFLSILFAKAAEKKINQSRI